MLRPSEPERCATESAADGPAHPIPLLFLVTNFDRGGAEKIVGRCALGLPRDKYAVQVAALQGRSQAMAGDLRRAGIPVHDLGMTCKGDLRVLSRLARLLRQERIRILFTFMFHPTLLGRARGLALRRARPDLVGADHGLGGPRAAPAEPVDGGAGDPRGGRLRPGGGLCGPGVPDPTGSVDHDREWRGPGPLPAAPARARTRVRP